MSVRSNWSVVRALDRAEDADKGSQGDKEAHNGLGIMYRDGLGVPVDKVKAYHFFQAAAGQDLAEAQVHLGKLHLGGFYLPRAIAG